MRSEVIAAAEALREAEDIRKPGSPVRHLLSPGDVEAAYAVQKANTQHWRDKGRRVVGRKIGLTAKAIQDQLGVDQPDFGTLFADMIYGSGMQIQQQHILQPRVEAEIAFVLKDDLDFPDPTVIDIIRATDFIAPALEIVCSRIADWDIDIVDTISDNASAGAMVIGGPVRTLDDIDLEACAMTMHINGSLAAAGEGAACMGNPLNAVQWLAATMYALGEPLRAGELVMSGALGPMAAAPAGARVTASFTGIGSVACCIP